MPAFVVDSAALSRNIEKLRRFTAAQIIAVVKGNGYGLGLVPYARFLTAQGVALLAVSTAAEAAALRLHGVTPVCLFSGSDREAPDARRIYGAAMERLPSVGWLADTVTRLIQGQIRKG